VEKYEGKAKIHMKMVVMRKGKEKQKCHIRKCNIRIRMRKKHLY
jgi:hypothetical protein